jgi:hypothetical protein
MLDESSGWVPYCDAISHAIESAKNCGQSQVSFTFKSFPYIVDFASMMQQNMSTVSASYWCTGRVLLRLAVVSPCYRKGTMRPIRRVEELSGTAIVADECGSVLVWPFINRTSQKR